MITRAEAEVRARKLANSKASAFREFRKRAHPNNPNVQPFSTTSFVSGFLACYDEMKKKEEASSESSAS